MDHIYFCPECRHEHTEPAEARLGHIALCIGCFTPDAADGVMQVETLHLEIHIAA